jgi:uncharacterized membrane-anchored protein
MRRARPWFLVIVLGQLTFLLAWAGYHEWVRANAPTVWLRVLPVDPRDPLRGDYAILNFEISTVPFPAGWAEQSYGTVWVRLAPGEDGLHEAVATSFAPPGNLAPGEYAVRAWLDGRRWDDRLRVRYEIEKFFVPEGFGVLPDGDTRAQVAITPRGALQLKGVQVDGRRWP